MGIKSIIKNGFLFINQAKIFAETEKGNSFLKSTPNIILFDTNFDRAVEKNRMVIESRKQNCRHDNFEKLLLSKGLIYAVNHRYGWKGVLKNAVKKIVPHGLWRKLKTFVKRSKK